MKPSQVAPKLHQIATRIANQDRPVIIELDSPEYTDAPKYFGDLATPEDEDQLNEAIADLGWLAIDFGGKQHDTLTYEFPKEEWAKKFVEVIEKGIKTHKENLNKLIDILRKNMKVKTFDKSQHPWG